MKRGMAVPRSWPARSRRWPASNRAAEVCRGPRGDEKPKEPGTLSVVCPPMAVESRITKNAPVLR